jgi:hypothetical protein
VTLGQLISHASVHTAWAIVEHVSAVAHTAATVSGVDAGAIVSVAAPTAFVAAVAAAVAGVQAKDGASPPPSLSSDEAAVSTVSIVNARLDALVRAGLNQGCLSAWVHHLSVVAAGFGVGEWHKKQGALRAHTVMQTVVASLQKLDAMSFKL